MGEKTKPFGDDPGGESQPGSQLPDSLPEGDVTEPFLPQSSGIAPSDSDPLRSGPSRNSGKSPHTDNQDSLEALEDTVPLPPEPGPTGKILGGRFEIIRVLGKGGMGRVYLVRDRQIEKRLVALKLLRSKYSQNRAYSELFFREIRTGQGFVSEHVVQVRDCGRLNDGHLFLTMDYVEGESLYSLMKREKTLAPRHALEIVRQILLGLKSGHEKGFIHRDVKPQNVMLSSQQPKTEKNPFGVQAGLLDFGISGLADEIEMEVGAGTAPYFSPEQSRGERLDPRSDVFSAGVLLYEMIAGQRPFKGRTAIEVGTSMKEVNLVQLIEDLEGTPKSLKKLLRKALQKDREDRFQSAAEFAKAIEKSSSFQPTEGIPSWIGAAALLLGATTAGSGFLILDQKSEIRTLTAERNQARNDSVVGKAFADVSQAQEDRTVSDLQLEVDRLTASVADLQPYKDKELENRNLWETKQTELLATVESEKEKARQAFRNASDHKSLATRRELVISELHRKIGEKTIKESAELQTALEFGRLLKYIGTKTLYRNYDGFGDLQKNNVLVRNPSSQRYLERFSDLARKTLGSSDALLGDLNIETLREFEDDLGWLQGSQLEEFLARAKDEQTSRWIGYVERNSDEIQTEIEKLIRDRLAWIAKAAEDENVDLESMTEEERAIFEQSLDNRLSQTDAERYVLGYAWSNVHAATTAQDLRDALDIIEQALVDARARLVKDAQDRATELVQVAGSQPERVTDYFQQYRDLAGDHVEALVESAVQSMENAAISGNSLTLNGLRSLPKNLEWFASDLREGQLKMTGPTPADPSTEGDGAALLTRLDWLSLAQSWYLDLDDAGPELATLRVPSLSEGSPLESSDGTPNWKAVLDFQIRIAKAIELGNQNSHLLPRSQGRAIFAVDLDGTHAWESQTCNKFDNETLTSSVNWVRYTSDGQRISDGSFTIESYASAIKKRALDFESTIVPIRQHDAELRLEYWKLSPEKIDRFKGEKRSIRAFQRLRSSQSLQSNPSDSEQGYLCLRVPVTEELTVWIHPEYGVVKEVQLRPGTDEIYSVSELVHVQ